MFWMPSSTRPEGILSEYVNNYPHKSLRKIKVTVYNYEGDIPPYLSVAWCIIW